MIQEHRAKATAVLLVVAIAGAGVTHAQVVRQLTDNKADHAYELAAVDEDGPFVYAVSTTNLFGGNPGLVPQLFRWDPVTGDGEMVTELPAGLVGLVSVTDSGNRIAFTASFDLGDNPNRSTELFTMRGDGRDVVQLTEDPLPNAGTSFAPVIAGSGNKIVFTSNSDLLGLNPDRVDQVYVVDGDGGNLRQLTVRPDPQVVGLVFEGYVAFHASPQYDISDDGQYVVFITTDDLVPPQNADHSIEIFCDDGTTITQLTTDCRPFGCYAPRITADGRKVVFTSQVDLLGTNTDFTSEIYLMNRDGTGLQQVTNTAYDSFAPSIQDDGSRIVYASDYSTPAINPNGWHWVWRIDADGTNAIPLTEAEVTSLAPVVNGTGEVVAFMTQSGPIPWGTSNPDQDSELNAMDLDGQGKVQLTDGASRDMRDPDFTPDGEWIVFSSNADLTGQNPDLGWEVYRMHVDGYPEQVTDLPRFQIWRTSISGDGEVIVFASSGDLVGANPDGSIEIFRIDADGGGLIQLTDATGSSSNPDLSSEGEVVVFSSDADLDGTTCSTDIFAIAPDGSGLTRLTCGPSSYDSRGIRVDDLGVWAVFTSTGDLTGANPDKSYEIFRVRTDNPTTLHQVTNSTYSSDDPDISGDGSRVVFRSDWDPLGTNPDHGSEIFLYDDASGLITQLTNTDSVFAFWNPRISRDGDWVYFVSDDPLAEVTPDAQTDAYRVHVPTGEIERVGAMRIASFWPVSHIDEVVPNLDGQRAVALVWGEHVLHNPDASDELLLIDRYTPARIHVGKEMPTQVDWDCESGPIRYDLIRGEVALLRYSMTPGLVELGPVLCLEDDSPDNTGAGHEDPELPPPGEAFFYLQRGSPGLHYGPGTYGHASDGSERVTGGGDCSG